MYNDLLENKLIAVDIVDIMQDYVSIQPDIDETKVKAAQLAAQYMDITRNINPENLARCINPVTDADEELREMILAPLCYFTYSRMLKMWQGVFTDGGFTTEAEGESRSAAKAVANEHYGIAETAIRPVIDWLEAENPEENVQIEKPTPRIRVFGGQEIRASN